MTKVAEAWGRGQCSRQGRKAPPALSDDYVADLLADELRVAMAQHGVPTIGQLPDTERRHPTAFTFKARRGAMAASPNETIG